MRDVLRLCGNQPLSWFDGLPRGEQVLRLAAQRVDDADYAKDKADAAKERARLLRGR